jgi:hypothetical protein
VCLEALPPLFLSLLSLSFSSFSFHVYQVSQ